MSPRDFCYWLRGYIEIHEAGDNDVSMTPEQVDCISRHLDLVMNPTVNVDKENTLVLNKDIVYGGLCEGLKENCPCGHSPCDEKDFVNPYTAYEPITITC